MFAPAISGQGTPDQQEMWLQRALNCNILGTYAQVRTGVVTGEFPHFLGKREFHYCVHKLPPLDLIQRQLNSVLSFTFVYHHQ